MREVGAGAAGGGYWVEVGGKGMKEGVFFFQQPKCPGRKVSFRWRQEDTTWLLQETATSAAAVEKNASSAQSVSGGFVAFKRLL